MRTVNLFGMKIHNTTLTSATKLLMKWCTAESDKCKYVVTPNVDHAVQFQKLAGLRAAYDRASLIVADGNPLVWASRLLGQTLPERVAGSDLVPSLLAAAPTANNSKKLRVFLLGAAPGVADRAAAQIEKKYPGVSVVGTHCPPLGFEHQAAENEIILNKVAAAKPDLLIIGLGAPKQELWVHAHVDQLQAKVAICAGATIDFLAGHKQRSPEWINRLGLEWLHRLATEPRRLASRYAYDALVFPMLFVRQLVRPRAIQRG